MPHIYLLVGSQTGTTDIVADAIANALADLGHQITVCLDPEIEDFTLEEEVVYLVCTSSSGQGQLPTNIATLPEDMIAAQIDLTGLRFGVLNLGDSSFPTYGGAGVVIDKSLRKLGAQRVGDIGLLDCLHQPVPSAAGVAWAVQWSALL